MNKHTLLRAGSLVLGACAPALAALAQANPANPDAAVPATRYQPSASYRAPAAPATTPDQNWKALNQTVGSINSMSLTMGGMDGDTPAAGHAQHQHGQAAQPAGHDHAQHGKSAAQPAMPPGHQHMGHQHHGGKQK